MSYLARLGSTNVRLPKVLGIKSSEGVIIQLKID